MLLVQIASVEQLSSAYAAARDAGAEVRVLGNGSNLLIRDGGVRGLVLQLGELFSEVSDPVSPARRACGTYGTGRRHAAKAVQCGSGPCSQRFGICERHSRHGGRRSLYERRRLWRRDEGRDHPCDRLPSGWTHRRLFQRGDGFRLRKSKINQQPEPIAITSVTVALTPADEETVRATMREFSARRREKQPLTLPSCGSTFKRPEGRFAGTLIEECGLKGCRVGGCSVSTLHAGFLVNDQQGSACDYLSLIAQVQKTVYEKTGVRLEPEVRIWGEDVCAKENIDTKARNRVCIF